MQVYIDTSPAGRCRRYDRRRRRSRLNLRELLFLFADRLTVYFILFLSFLLLSVRHSEVAMNTRSFSFVAFLVLEVLCFLVFCLAFDRHRGGRRRGYVSDDEDNVSINNNITVARLHPTETEDPLITAARELLTTTTTTTTMTASRQHARFGVYFPVAELVHTTAEGSVVRAAEDSGERREEEEGAEARLSYGHADYIRPPVRINSAASPVSNVVCDGVAGFLLSH